MDQTIKESERSVTIYLCDRRAIGREDRFHAYALMRGKKISDMEVSGLKKKFKDKAFAANCSREIIMEIEKTGLSLDEFFRIAIESVKNIKSEIGLE